jgi:hypothetical protein
MNDCRDRLRRELSDAGLVEGHRRDDGTDATPMGARVGHGDLADADQRGHDTVCCFCCRTVHRQRRVKITDTEYACGRCASLPQDPDVQRLWLATPRPARLRRTIQHHGIDPASHQPRDVQIEWAELIEKDTGEPLALDVQTTWGRIPTVGMPNSYWTELFAHGGIAT